MDDAPAYGGAAAVSPDRLRAISALGMASGMLSLAQELYSRGEFAQSFEESRNAIRMASSALLLQGGYVSASLEDTISYLSAHHPGVFPTEEWQRLEEIPLSDSPGLYNMILSAMGKVKKAGEQEASEAILAAESFISSAASEMGL